ncbi:unnamed protein product, partial [Iphiclides podalirius]
MSLTFFSRSRTLELEHNWSLKSGTVQRRCIRSNYSSVQGASDEARTVRERFAICLRARRAKESEFRRTLQNAKSASTHFSGRVWQCRWKSETLTPPPDPRGRVPRLASTKSAVLYITKCEWAGKKFMWKRQLDQWRKRREAAREGGAGDLRALMQCRRVIDHARCEQTVAAKPPPPPPPLPPTASRFPVGSLSPTPPPSPAQVAFAVRLYRYGIAAML